MYPTCKNHIRKRRHIDVCILALGTLFVTSSSLLTHSIWADEHKGEHKNHAPAFASVTAASATVAPATARDATISTSTGSPSARNGEESRHAQQVGPPRILEAEKGVFVAVGYDVANVVVVATPEGNVVIDTGSCDERAQEIRDAMESYAPGATRAIIYTHHHIEQTGGGGVWAVEPDAAIWATEAMPREFLRQYMVLDGAELRRGIRQFGLELPESSRMPSTLGRNPDPSSLNTVPTVRMPTKTFRGETEFQVGGVTFHLIEAPGETNDHLMVWIPSLEVLAVGDNFIRGFPEVHHVRGAPLREPGQWVATLDAMRALNPKHVISARHEPVSGRESVRAALIDYRDALQWLRNETLRAINRGDSIDSAAETITLPKHLAESPFLTEDTGCVERAVRAIYTSYVGWFDERPEALFPSDQESIAQREIRMMGGHEAVLVAARKAGQDGDHRWALHLLAKLRDDSAEPDAWREQYATTLKALAGEVSDSSGASYLVSAANELTSKAQAPELKKCPDDETIQQIPLETILDMMCLRIKTDRVLDVHESVVVYITDEDRQFNVTIRHGIAEVDEGEPLPEMPKPEAILVTDGLTFRKMCMGILSPVAAVAIGDLKIRGSRLAAMRFSRRFECKQLYEKPETSETVRLSASDKGRTSGAR